MSNYIIRIYRRKKDDPRLLVGIVEEVGRQGRKAFINVNELWDILNYPVERRVLAEYGVREEKPEKPRTRNRK